MAKRGPPTKYNAEIVSKAWQYLDVYEDLGDMIPSVEGLAMYLRLSRETLYAWDKQKEKQDISDILSKLKAKQLKVLIDNGLSGKFNAQITKLVLGLHGIREKTDTDVTSGGKRIKNNWAVLPVTTDKDA